MKKDEPTEMEEAAVDLGGHGHIGSEKKKAAEIKKSQEEDLLGVDDVRLARRNTAPHIGAAAGLFLNGRTSNMSPSVGDGPSIFDSIGEEEGLESFLFSASSSRVSRDLSMSPFSRIRNDLENFVEESDRDIEARLLVPQSPQLRGEFGASTWMTSVPHSPLISSTTAREDLPCAESSTVWVGNLDGETTEAALIEAFESFGPIQSVKVLDSYAFIRYEDPSSATMAIAEMNGHTLGSTVIRTGVGRDDSQGGLNRKASFELAPFGSLMGGAAKSVWVGNLPLDTDERTLMKIFSSYGGIENIRLVPAKHCAFINFSRAELAAAAIAELDGHLKIGDELVKLGYAKHAVQQPVAAPTSSLAVPKTAVRRSSTGSINYSTSASGIGLPNPSRMDVMNLPGDSSEQGNMESLRNIFGAMDVNSQTSRSGIAGFQSAILTPAPKPPNITVTSSSANNAVQQQIHADGSFEDQSIDYCWDIPELPPPYFGPDLTPGRIRDYRRHVESLNCKPSEFDLIAMEILPVAVSASTDPVGNVLVQKLIERGSDELKSMIISELEPYMASIGIHKNGTWVVQKLINWCTLPEHQMSVAESLKPYLVPLFQDQFGNYVIQCCLQFEQGRNQFIMDGLASQTLRIANSRFGSRAMRSCLESPHTTPKQQKQVAASVLENAGKLLVDPNGVIVMQWLLDSDLPGKYKIMQPVLEATLPSLLGLRFASNLVTKLLTQSAEPDVRERLLDMLNINPEQTSSSMQTLLKESSCVQIVSKILLAVPSLQRMSFVDALRKALGTMIQHAGSNPPSHLVRLAAELKDSKKTAQGTFDLSHLITISSDTSSASATPSPQPVIITSKLRAHVESQTSTQEHPHFVFGTQHLAPGKSSEAGPSSQHRSGSVPENQKF